MTNLKAILRTRYQAILLDIGVFALNLALMASLKDVLGGLAAEASVNAPGADFTMALFCCALAFLLPVSSILKRQQAHQADPDLSPEGFFANAGKLLLAACFITQLMVLILIVTLLVDASGSGYEVPTGLLAGLFVGVPALAVVNTLVLYSYFVPPKGEPLLKALKSPLAATVGDAFLFLGTMAYQLLWWYLLDDAFFIGPPKDIGDLIGKIAGFTALALLFYFPPRIFYLADDPYPKTTWLRMALANLPILLRILLGIGA